MVKASTTDVLPDTIDFPQAGKVLGLEYNYVTGFIGGFDCGAVEFVYDIYKEGDEDGKAVRKAVETKFGPLLRL